jgi:hypothetical protein
MEPLAEILRNFSSLESLRLSGCLKGQACFLTVCMCMCVGVGVGVGVGVDGWVGVYVGGWV